MKTSIPLAKARRAAEQIAERLQPFCKRIEIAGSIRREKPFCGDIDLVAEPSDEPALRARILEGKEVIQNGPQNIYVRLANKMEVNVFLARPETSELFETKPSNFGSLFLLRTGSREHNIRLLNRAKSLGKEWRTHEGVFQDGKLIASATEEEIFEALKLPFTPPNLRDGLPTPSFNISILGGPPIST